MVGLIWFYDFEGSFRMWNFFFYYVIFSQVEFFDVFGWFCILFIDYLMLVFYIEYLFDSIDCQVIKV